MTKKEIDTKLKAATEAELRQFVKGLLVDHGDVLKPAFDSFSPKRMPSTPAKDDPLLKTCFRCKGEQNLRVLKEELKICQSCYSELFDKHGENLTRERVMDIFGFSKSEADKIPRSTGRHNYFGSVYYLYSLSSVLKAAKKKYGSFYDMIKSNQR